MPRAFITGITGQDGQHLAEFLHGKGYQVFGMLKGQNNPRAQQIREEFPYVELVPGDLADLPSLVSALEYAQPDEVYNLGAISFVAISFGQAELTSNITGLGVLRLLEAVRMVGGTQNNKIRFYQASSSERDWGYAGDYVRAMWMMLQQDQPDDYVVATGETHSIEEYLTLAFAEAGLDDWRKYVRQDPKFFRPAEVDPPMGDPSKAREKLGWTPEVDFPGLVKMMVQHDLALEASKTR